MKSALAFDTTNSKKAKINNRKTHTSFKHILDFVSSIHTQHKNTKMDENIEYISESELSTHLCRVCEQEANFELSKNKFNFNDVDVLLITAFNCFSTIENVRNHLILFTFLWIEESGISYV